MNYITKKHISRRTLMRGVGVTLALPLLDSMVPAQTPLAKTAASGTKQRFSMIFAPHGWARDYCYPKTVGALTEMPYIFKPLEAFKDRITIVSGLDSKSAMPPPGTSGGDHSRTAATCFALKYPLASATSSVVCQSVRACRFTPACRRLASASGYTP